MKRIAKTYKLPIQLIADVHAFCDTQGMEYSFFVSKAMEENLKKELGWKAKRDKKEAQEQEKASKLFNTKF